MTDLRFLGFSFAGADLLIELDPRGRIAFAAGASPDDSGAGATLLENRQVTDVLCPQSADTLLRAMRKLRAGSRTPPIDVLLVNSNGTRRRAVLRAFLAPGLAPHVSCSLLFAGGVETLAGDTEELARLTQTLADHLAAGEPGVLSLVEVNGLGDAIRAMRKSDGASLAAGVSAAVRAEAASPEAAAQLSSDRFALLQAAGGAETLVRKLQDLVGSSLDVRATELELDHDQPIATLRLLRVVLDQFLAGGLGTDPQDLGRRFRNELAGTIRDVARLRTSLSATGFNLHFQPVVDLDEFTTHHFEALARFRGGDSCAATIRLAEEMDLIGPFDLEVHRKALALVDTHGCELAINLSARTLDDDRLLSELLSASAPRPDLRRNLILEVTETAALNDLAAAERRIQSLRTAGYSVYLDDFGAGAASFDYLRALTLDGIKLDGRFVLNVGSEKRLRDMVRHLCALADTLDIQVVAEMIETSAAALLLRQLGVRYGQGWHFGRPQARLSGPHRAMMFSRS